MTTLWIIIFAIWGCIGYRIIFKKKNKAHVGLGLDIEESERDGEDCWYFKGTMKGKPFVAMYQVSTRQLSVLRDKNDNDKTIVNERGVISVPASEALIKILKGCKR